MRNVVAAASDSHKQTMTDKARELGVVVYAQIGFLAGFGGLGLAFLVMLIHLGSVPFAGMFVHASTNLACLALGVLGIFVSIWEIRRHRRLQEEGISTAVRSGPAGRLAQSKATATVAADSIAPGSSMASEFPLVN